MVINDPIADMLTRIRNAQVARHDTVTMPASNMKKSIAKLMQNEGFIKSYEVIDDGLQGEIKITLKYLDKKPRSDSPLFQPEDGQTPYSNGFYGTVVN